MSIRSLIRAWLNAPDRQEREAKVDEQIYKLRLDVQESLHRNEMNEMEVSRLQKSIDPLQVSKHFTETSLESLSISIGRLSSRVDLLETNSAGASKSQVTSGTSR